MTLQTSGAISIDDIVGEFGGTSPDSITEYYRGGGLVPDNPTNINVPTSGTISLTDFYGAAAGPAGTTYLVSLDLGRSPGIVPQNIGYHDGSRGTNDLPFSGGGVWTFPGNATGGTDFIIGSNNRTIVAMGFFNESNDDFYVYLNGTGHTGEITAIDIEHSGGTVSLGAANFENPNDAGDTRYLWVNTGVAAWTTLQANNGTIRDVTFTMT